MSLRLLLVHGSQEKCINFFYIVFNLEKCSNPSLCWILFFLKNNEINGLQLVLEPKETPSAQFQRQCSHPEVSSAWMIEEFLAVRIKASIPLEPVQPDPTGQKKSFPLPLADGTEGYQWCIPAYQSPWWPSDSLRVLSICYTLQSP